MRSDLFESGQNPLSEKIWTAIRMLKTHPLEKTEHCVGLFLLSLQHEKGIEDSALQLKGPITVISEACKAGAGETAAFYSAAYEVFAPVLEKIPDEELTRLMQSFSALTPEISNEAYGQVFDAVLYQMARFYGPGFGEALLPEEVARFICQLADAGPDATIYNPFAGFASFGVFAGDFKRYVAEEIDPIIHQTGLLRLRAHGKLGFSELKKQDSIESLKPADLYNPKNDGYDLVIANPPYALRVDKAIGGMKRQEATEYFIEQALEYIKPGGKLIALVSGSFLFNQRNSIKELRKLLTDQNLLDAVIALPSGLLYHTYMSANILVISKKKEKKKTVTFADASQFIEKSDSKEIRKLLQYKDLVLHLKNNTKSDHLTEVDKGIISQFEYNLNPLLYLESYKEPYIERKHLTSLGKVIEPIQTRTRLSENSKKEGFVISPKDLNAHGEELLKTDKLQLMELKRPLGEVTESCLLLSMTGKDLRPTYFQYQNTPVYISPAVRAFRIINSKVDPAYLIYTLNSPGFRNRVRTGTSNLQHVLSNKELLNFSINLPPLELQRAKVEGIREMEEKCQHLKQERDQLQATISHKYYQVFSSLKHSMGSYLMDMGSNVRILKNTLKANKIDSEKISVTNNISLEDHISSLEKKLEIISGLLENVKEDFDRNRAGSERIEFIDFFREFARECKTKPDKNITIEIHINPDLENNQETSPVIRGNRALLHSALNNIVDNAYKHAFTGFKKNYKLLLKLDIQSSQDLPRVVAHFFEENDVLLKIEIANNGEPFPEGFTREHLTRIRLKAGKTGNQGVGGFDIDDIVKRHNGYFDLILTDPDEGEFVTIYCIYLPLA